MKMLTIFRDYFGIEILSIAVLVWFIAAPAGAQTDPVRIFSEGVLFDSACTDDYDTPAVGTIANPQTSGSSDGFCDGDTKVVKGVIAADTDSTVLGSVNYQSGFLRIDADGVGGATPTWRICLKVYEPWTADTWSQVIGCSSTVSGTGDGDDFIGLGSIFGYSQFDLADPIRQPLPKRFKVQIDLIDATTWAGSVGFIPVRGGGASPALAVDDLSGAQIGIDFEHHECHEGDCFHAEYSLTTASSDDDVTGILFKTPDAGPDAHMVITVSSSDPAEAIINEGPTLADAGDGSDLAVYNRFRSSANTSTLESLEDTPTVGSLTSMNEAEWTAIGVSSGTELEHRFLGGGGGPFAVGGTTRGTQEWAWKPDTIYAIYLQNTGANANTHHISLDWYEHTSRAE